MQVALLGATPVRMAPWQGFMVVGTGVDPVTYRFSGGRSTN